MHPPLSPRTIIPTNTYNKNYNMKTSKQINKSNDIFVGGMYIK
jgi:hypothetical protein